MGKNFKILNNGDVLFAICLLEKHLDNNVKSKLNFLMKVMDGTQWVKTLPGDHQVVEDELPHNDQAIPT